MLDALRINTPGPSRSVPRKNAGTCRMMVSPDSGSITTIETLPKKEAAESKPAARIEDRVYDPTTSKVRTVGPLFLPENSTAIDLGRPADAGVN